MGGRITIKDLGGDIVSTKTFDCEPAKLKIIETWKRLYGKGWNRIVQEVEYDKPKQKSRFKKGELIKTYRFHKGNNTVGKSKVEKDGR